MKIHLPLDLRLSSGDIFRSSIIFVVIIASLVFASVRAVAVDNEGGFLKRKSGSVSLLKRTTVKNSQVLNLLYITETTLRKKYLIPRKQ
ncbi:hypothetical protein FRC0016_02017 [Corynebacterium diphtheriae]|nr:hypothetical protein FRC0016_02017 [Corynebacterium diphtheriae]